MHFTVFLLLLFCLLSGTAIIFNKFVAFKARFFFKRHYREVAVRRCFSKQVFLRIRNIHRKTTALESVFNNVAGLKARNFIKVTPTQVLSCEYCRIFKSGYFYRTPPVAAYKYPLHCMKSVRIRKNREQKKFPMRQFFTQCSGFTSAFRCGFNVTYLFFSSSR